MAPKPFDDDGLHSSPEQVLIVQSENFSPARSEPPTFIGVLGSFLCHPSSFFSFSAPLKSPHPFPSSAYRFGIPPFRFSSSNPTRIHQTTNV
jgi:hypothetical protein